MIGTPTSASGGFPSWRSSFQSVSSRVEESSTMRVSLLRIWDRKLPGRGVTRQEPRDPVTPRSKWSPWSSPVS